MRKAEILTIGGLVVYTLCWTLLYFFQEWYILSIAGLGGVTVGIGIAHAREYKGG